MNVTRARIGAIPTRPCGPTGRVESTFSSTQQQPSASHNKLTQYSQNLTFIAWIAILNTRKASLLLSNGLSVVWKVYLRLPREMRSRKSWSRLCLVVDAGKYVLKYKVYIPVAQPWQILFYANAGTTGRETSDGFVSLYLSCEVSGGHLPQLINITDLSVKSIDQSLLQRNDRVL